MKLLNGFLCLMVVSMLLLGGCTGAVATVPENAVLVAGYQQAVTVSAQAAAGTLLAADCPTMLINVGDAAQAIDKQHTANFFSYLLNPQTGLLITDANYTPALETILADCIAAGDLCKTGAWSASQATSQTVPPTQAELSAMTGYSMQAMELTYWMTTATTTPVSNVNLKSASAAKLLKSQARAMQTKPRDVTSLINQVAAKLPAGWLAAYNKLPTAVKDQINNDLPVVAGLGNDQISSWWASYLAGDRVAALLVVRHAMSPAQLAAAFSADNQAATAAINQHVATNVLVLTIGINLVSAIIPAVIGLL